jgi:hypothetical protein
VTPNPFDQAARYAAHQLDDAGFRDWLLPRVTARYHFHRWLNTRNTPFPGEPERICDTVAAWTHQEGTAPPLATVIEFLSQPSAPFLEHLAAYTYQVRRDHPYQTEPPVVRYEVIGVLVVLTGTEQAKTWQCRPTTWKARAPSSPSSCARSPPSPRRRRWPGSGPASCRAASCRGSC